MATEVGTYDYIVVGSGAGGGPVAANLARAGYVVLLLEAGGDDEPFNYQVPAFHPFATEDETLRWDFFVRHYGADAKARRDPKFVTDRSGVLYPRASTLGGCTAHHALISIYPHQRDWDSIATLTGDASWSSENMRQYFERLEHCDYVERPDDPTDPKQNPGRHGFDGWLHTEAADPSLLFEDKNFLKLVNAAALETFSRLGRPLSRLVRRLQSHLDPNDWRLVKDGSEGAVVTPLSTRRGKRHGPRELIRKVQEEHPDRLIVRMRALASKILLDDDQRAIGVEFLEGPSLYRADPRASQSDEPIGSTCIARCRREVILAGGAFNTPQLLMLSGIGPRQHLEHHGIECRVDLEGVGTNLQDRYEVGVVSEMREDFPLLKGATLEPPGPGEEPDPPFREWLQGKGVYTTNGAVFSVVKRSSDDKPDPDLFLFGIAASFEGYFPGYSNRFKKGKRFFTWAILKGHTDNNGGTVRLRSADPRDVPDINFRYFDDGNAPTDDDLEAVVEGVKYAREINARTGDLIYREVVPGPSVSTDEEIREFIKDNAWGHHASCSCPIGPREQGGCLGSDFRVHGTTGLRVVDASVFPRIPGFFIVVPIYMISEKASDAILADARRD